MSKRDTLKAISHGWGRRTLKTGRIAASVAKAGAKRIVRSSEEDDGAFGDALLSQMDQMKGFAMKVGQILSYMDGVLPEETARRLRALQQGAQPVDFGALRPGVEAALGAPLGELFDTFDEEPIAAASIGQVHRATLGGRDLAVKVQYPHVAETFKSDFTTLRSLSRLASLGTHVDGPAVTEELELRFLEECDYAREASWQRAFAAGLRVEGVRVPDVIAERSARTVLTTAFSEGRSFYDFAENSTQAERDRAGARLFEVVFGSLFRHGALNADPHPGNYLFEPDGLVLLDWGCVRAYSKDFMDTWKALARVVLAEDRGRFEEVFRATGMVASPRFDFDAQWEQMLYLYEPFMTEGFRYTAEYVARSYEFVMPQHNPNLRRMAMPPAWVWAHRLQWGLNSVLAHLNAQADWPTLYRRCLNAPWEPIRIGTEPGPGSVDPRVIPSEAPPSLW